MAKYKSAGKYPANYPNPDDAGKDIQNIILNPCDKYPNGAVIPFDPTNTDYQEYLEWVAAGNTAEAAD